jgi:glycosyltransferase involved in cell wall biosynthesis
MTDSGFERDGGNPEIERIRLPVPKPCRILYISSTYSRSENDNQNPWMIDTIRHLKSRGYEIEVLAPSYRGLRTHTVGGVLVHRFRYFFRDRETLTHDQGAPNKIRGSLLFKLLLFPYVFFGTLAAMRLARNARYDFIHCHWPFPHGLMGWAACLTARGNPRLILHFHGASLLLAAKFKPIAPILRFCLRRSDGVVCNSSFTAGMVTRLMPVDQTVIGFGSPLSGDPLPPARNDVRIILTVGRVVERKGIAYLLRALPAVAAVVDAKVAIVGSGDPKVEADLRALTAGLGLQDRVEFAGKVPEADLIRWYRSCDVFCLPAIVDSQGETEGLGVVLLEALNYARPVVASEVGGIPDIIKDGRTGLLCPQKDPAALAAALLKVLSNPTLAETLGRQGHGFIRTDFSWDRIVAKWEDFYARTLSSGRPADTRPI